MHSQRDESAARSQDSLNTSSHSRLQACKLYVKDKLVPSTVRVTRTCYDTSRIYIVRYGRLSAARVGKEVSKIHRTQHWGRRCSVTLFDNTIGLGLAMMAGNIVQSSVEVEGFSNLWGLFASKPVVSQTTYDVLSFSVEFVITLVVFTVIEHYLSEYRHNAEEKKAQSTDSLVTDQ